MQKKEHGDVAVLTEISLSVEMCAMALNISMSNIQLVTLCNDIMESYPHDSIEDVRECFKNARRGMYGFGMNSRNSLNMILVREWMSLHLESKASARYQNHMKSKVDKQFLEKVDYEAYKIRVKKEDGVKKSESDKDREYNQYKAKFLAARENENKQ